jgi:hypothetical protein
MFVPVCVVGIRYDMNDLEKSISESTSNWTGWFAFTSYAIIYNVNDRLHNNCKYRWETHILLYRPSLHLKVPPYPFIRFYLFPSSLLPPKDKSNSCTHKQYSPERWTYRLAYYRTLRLMVRRGGCSEHLRWRRYRRCARGRQNHWREKGRCRTANT